MGRRMVIVLLLCVLIWSAVVPWGFAREADEALSQPADLQQKTLLLNMAVAGGIFAWGIANWDYFQATPRGHREQWFGLETKYGGADKIGHLYTTYAAGRLFRHVYLKWGYDDDTAGRLGILSSLGAMTLMEVGDSFSDDIGFSYEDLLMNLAGAGFGYLMMVNPQLDRKLDLRVEYWPEFGGDVEWDLFTDYEQHKYLLAVKADGFECLADSWLKYFELQVGYYTRNYSDYHVGGLDRRKRVVYAGVGLNVGKIVERWVKAPLLDYVQVPYTYLPLAKNLD